MKTAFASFPRTATPAAAERGHAFVVALMILAIISSLSALAITRTSSSARMNSRATDFAEGERVADGMLEYAYGLWKTATQNRDGALTPTDLTTLGLATPTPPAVPNFAVIPSALDANGPLAIRPADKFGAPTTTVAPVFQYLEDYPGWRGYVYSYVASVKLKATTGLSAGRYITGAKRTFEYIQVPLFQSMFFFEDTLELYRTAPMIVGGLVHSNSRLMVSGMKDTNYVDLTFNGNVSYAGGTPAKAATPAIPASGGSPAVPATPAEPEVLGYTYNELPIGAEIWSNQTRTAALNNMEQGTFGSGGVNSQLAKVKRYEPLGTKPASVLDDPAGAAGDSDGNPNNDSYREIIEPPITTGGITDPAEISKRRLYSKAGIIMEIAGTAAAPTVTVATQNGTSLTSPQVDSLKATFTGRTTIYDQREGADVDLASIDVSLLTPVLNAASGFNGVIYIHDTTPKVNGDREPRAVRLKKGGVLPNVGLTVASQNPVYIQGDYNTGTTTSTTAVPANNTGNPNNTDSPVVAGYTRKPSAVIADAVMLLSNKWVDTDSDEALATRDASNTTYNTAILAGFTPSGWDPDGANTGVAAYGYSGGANNYPRFLETWSGKTCTYYGSMVELFRSQVFTGKWDTGNIYSPPARRWNYDTLFNSTPPPGSVDAITTSRGPWARL